MRYRSVLCLILATWLLTGTAVQAAGTKADHEALRDLKSEITKAINAKDMAAAARVLHQPFMATVITQDSFTEFEPLKGFFESLYTRKLLRIDNLKIEAEADEVSQIYEGTFAVTRGSTRETYQMADGRSFDMAGRWTAVTTKTEDGWKLLAIHTGVNFLDNPVINAIEKSLMWFAAGGLGLGLLLGFAGGWFARRRRA